MRQRHQMHTAKAALQSGSYSCLEKLKAKLSQTKEILVRVQAETRVSVRAIVTKPIRLVQIEHAQSVMVSSIVLDDAAPAVDSLKVHATAAPVDAVVRTWQHR